MEKELGQSLDRVDRILSARLKKLKASTTLKDLKELNAILELKMNLTAVKDMQLNPEDIVKIIDGNEEHYYEPEDEYEEDGMHFITIACKIIVNLYKMLDVEKIRETESDWLLEDCQEFMLFARESFGRRIPELPPMLISGPKKKGAK